MSTQRAVYIVDSDRRSVQAIVKQSIGWNLATSAFFSAEEAWQELTGGAQLPACLLTEFQLPGMSGLCLQARMNRGQIHIPVIFYSNPGSQESVVPALKAGAVDYLPKPVSPIDLLDRIEFAIDLCERWRRESAYFDGMRAILSRLTPRDRHFVERLVEGKTSKEISSELHVGLPSVTKHRLRLLRLFRARDVVALTVKMMEYSRHADPPWLRLRREFELLASPTGD